MIAGLDTDAPKVREATEYDAVAVRRLLIEAYAEFRSGMDTPAWEALRKGLETAFARMKDAVRLVATDGEDVVGFAVYMPPGVSDLTIFPPNWASIRLLGVPPQCRGRGTSRALIETCIAYAKADHAPAIGLHAAETMTAARALYEDIGFTLEREIEPRFGKRYFMYRLDLD